MNVSGKVISVREKEQIGEKFSKRCIWIELPDDKYPQTINVEFQQDKCNLLDDISINDDVTIDVNLRGRLWINPKNNVSSVFNTIVGWKITVDKKETVSAKKQIKVNEPIGDSDDLPF